MDPGPWSTTNLEMHWPINEDALLRTPTRLGGYLRFQSTPFSAKSGVEWQFSISVRCIRVKLFVGVVPASDSSCGDETTQTMVERELGHLLS